ncbi:MAG: tetraacyldisaccharide 4'-kinase [Candidatus Eisenbacteria bacterium]|nr:tetraacyldisaccharide 4'-kinase [Candidatus Eisenbacteria bacterium]
MSTGKTNPLFLPLSIVYLAGVEVRLILFRLGVLRRSSAPGPVISVGNLTAGGTGKTVVVEKVARLLAAMGAKPAVLTRGYGRSSRSTVAILGGKEDGEEPGFQVAGDEPLLLSQKLHDVPVVVGKRRVRSAFLASRTFGSKAFVLDDGFQHISLKRDLDIVLIDSAEFREMKYLLPAGPMRERWSSLGRAGLVVLTKTDEGERDILQRLKKRLPPGVPVLSETHRAVAVKFPWSGRVEGVEFLNGKNVIALSGIGRPSSFERLISRHGARVLHSLRYPDHHSYSKKDLKDAFLLQADKGASFVVTTEKDEKRIPFLPEYGKSLGVVVIEADFGGDEEKLKGCIEKAAGPILTAGRKTG